MDNDPKKALTSTMEQLKKLQLKIFPCPSQSPDLNLIDLEPVGIRTKDRIRME